MYLVWVPFQSEMKKLGAISDNKINLGAILVICRKYKDKKSNKNAFLNQPPYL